MLSLDGGNASRDREASWYQGLRYLWSDRNKHSGVAFECEAQSGMHINEDNFIAEIIDPDTGEVLPEGSKGELVFTSITKEAFLC